MPVTNVRLGPAGAGGAGELALQEREGADRRAPEAQPGKLTFGHAGHRLADPPRGGELRQCRGASTRCRLPYKGEGPALVGLVGGDTTFAVTNVAAAIGHIQVAGACARSA